jgi:hypothetical protein
VRIRVVQPGGGEYEAHNIGVNWPRHIFVNQDFNVAGAEQPLPYNSIGIALTASHVRTHTDAITPLRPNSHGWLEAWLGTEWMVTGRSGGSFPYGASSGRSS